MNNKRQILSAIIAVLISVGLVATAVYATTTIGNNVDVGGTLDVTGATTLDSTLTVTATTTLNGTFVIGTSASPMTLAAAGTRAIDVWTTSGLTSGLSKSVTIDAVGTETGGDVRAFDVGVHSENVRLGNATGVVGKVYLEDTGSVSGLAASLFGYLKMFDSASQGTGTYVPLNLTIDAPSSFSGATTMAFIRFELAGSTTYLDDMVRLFNLTGLTDETGHLLYNNTLKMKVNTTTWYMPLSSAEGSYTTAYPIVSSYGGSVGISLTGTATTGIDIGTTTSYGIRIGGTTGVGIRIDKASNTGPTLHIHSHQRAHDSGDDMVANDFKGEFLGTSGLMDGIRAQYTMDASSTGVLRSIISNAYLGTGATLSSSGYLIGLLGNVNVNSGGTVDGSGVILAGLVGGLLNMEGATLTEVKYMSAIWASSHATQLPATGETQLILMTNGLGATLKQAMYIDANDRITNFIRFDNVDGMVTISGTEATGTPAKIKILIDGTPYYINARPTSNN